MSDEALAPAVPTPTDDQATPSQEVISTTESAPAEGSSEDAEYRAAMKEAGVKMMDDRGESAPDLEKMKEESDEEEEENLDFDEEKEESLPAPEKKEEQKQEDTNQDSAENAGKITIKVNGEDQTITDMAEIQRLAQHGVGANNKMQEAARVRKQAEQFINDLKADPFRVLQNRSLGIDVREAAEKYLFHQLERDSLTPEQREIADQREADRQDLERLRYEERNRNEAHTQEQQQQNQNQHKEAYRAQIGNTLSEAGLPNTDWTVSRMAGYMRQAMAKGIEAGPRDLVKYVQQDWAKMQQDHFGKVEDTDKLIEMLGADTMERIRKHQVSKYKTTKSQPAQVATQANTQNQDMPQFSSMEEMRDHMLGSYNK